MQKHQWSCAQVIQNIYRWFELGVPLPVSFYQVHYCYCAVFFYCKVNLNLRDHKYCSDKTRSSIKLVGYIYVTCSWSFSNANFMDDCIFCKCAYNHIFCVMFSFFTTRHKKVSSSCIFVNWRGLSHLRVSEISYEQLLCIFIAFLVSFFLLLSTRASPHNFWFMSQ